MIKREHWEEKGYIETVNMEIIIDTSVLLTLLAEAYLEPIRTSTMDIFCENKFLAGR